MMQLVYASLLLIITKIHLWWKENLLNYQKSQNVNMIVDLPQYLSVYSKQ